MSVRTPRDAVLGSVHRLQVALSCVTKAVLRPSPGGYDDTGKMHALVLNDGRPAPLHGRPRMMLGVKTQYRIAEDPGPAGPWRMRAAAYKYAIETADGQELVVYHWHPSAPGPVTYPHVHFGSTILQPDGVLGHRTTCRLAGSRCSR